MHKYNYLQVAQLLPMPSSLIFSNEINEISLENEPYDLLLSEQQAM